MFLSCRTPGSCILWGSQYHFKINPRWCPSTGVNRLVSFVPQEQLEQCKGKEEMPVVNLLQHVCSFVLKFICLTSNFRAISSFSELGNLNTQGSSRTFPPSSTPPQPSAVVMDVPFSTLGFRWITNNFLGKEEISQDWETFG